MRPGLETQTIDEARRLLTDWLGAPSPRFQRERKVDGGTVDLFVEQGRLRLAVEFKGSGEAAVVRAAAVEAKKYADTLGKAIPVVAVPFMGDVGKRICAEADTSWFDLSGNAKIVAPGLRVIIEGKPNRFVRTGRPATAFAPRSARIARRLLIEPGRSFRQQELANETGLDDGFTSRIVHKLEDDQLVERADDGTVRVKDPALLLDAWSERYDFEKHTIVPGHASARTSEELLERLGGALQKRGIRHAASGLAGAWLLTQFAGFRLVTFFVEERPSAAFTRELGFRAEPKGANVWLVVPNDAGVFDGAALQGGLACVHPVQAYLDLLGHPERAKEAAAEVRKRLLRWSR